MRSPGLCILFAAMLLTPAAHAQRGGRGGTTAASDEKPEEGIPVTDALVISKCSTCHAKDEKGNLSRISWERSTPEGWEEAIKRMVRLNGLTLTPADARSIVKYLATYHGLAPSEAKPVMYMPEHRMIDETLVPDETVRGACTTCHPIGRALSWRRTRADWQLLENLHVGLYAQAEAHFRRSGRGGGGGAAAPGQPPTAATEAAAANGGGLGPEPGVAALDFLAKAAPLHTPEWAEWRARLRAPRIAGKWLVSAYLPGYGKYTGEMTISPGAADDEFKTAVTLKSMKTGATIKRTGSSLVYAGYSWRGRSKSSAAIGPKPDDPNHDLRETLWISPDQSMAEGRWFWGEYQEFGFDVKLVRASAEPTLVSVDTYSVKTGTKGAQMHIIADNLPATIVPEELDLGAGVKLGKIVSHTKTDLVVTVDIAADAVPGKRDIAYGRSSIQGAFAVYSRIDYIKVTPETALARLGSDVHPKGYQQFEAIGFANGADGKAHTADDLELGPLDVTWSVEEFMAVYGDDDKQFVGELNDSALFTPALDGPNPKRKFSRNNYGDVWVVATSNTEKDKEGKPLSGRAYLVVTVPTYIKWDQPEVSQ